MNNTNINIYSEELTKEMEHILVGFDFLFFDDYIVYNENDANIIRDLFGVNETLFNIFNKDYIVSKKGPHLFVHHRDYDYPISCVNTFNKRYAYISEDTKLIFRWTSIKSNPIFKTITDLDKIMDSLVNE